MDTEKSRVVEGLVGELDEYGGFAFIRFMVTDADGNQVELRLTQGGRLMLISGEGRTMIGGVELKTVWDDAGGEVARLLFLQEEGLDRYGGIIVLSRRLPSRPVLLLSNEEHVIEMEPGQKYLDVSGMLKRIIGGEEYSRLSREMGSGDTVLGVAYLKQDGGVDSAWAQSADAEFKEAEDVLSLIIVRKNGLSAVSPDGGVRAELSGGSLRFHGVKGMREGTVFRVSEARFRELSGYGQILEMTLPSGEAILFRVDVGGDGGTVSSKLALAIERYVPEINPVEYYGELKIMLSEGGQTFEYTLRDLMVVEYVDSRGVHRTVVGLSEPLPDKVLNEPQHVAAKLFTKEIFEGMRYKILEEEKHLKEKKVFLDFFVETPSSKLAIVECKHGDESSGDLVSQAYKYLEIAMDNGWKLIYSFLHAPQTSETKELLSRLVELMRQYPRHGGGFCKWRMTEYWMVIKLDTNIKDKHSGRNERMGVSAGMIDYELKFMLYKGIKYIPAIVYTTWELERSYERPRYYTSFESVVSLTKELSRMLIDAYIRLRRKVKGARTLRKGGHLRPEEVWCELDTTRVVWPPQTLDLEEVQEEIRRLTEGAICFLRKIPRIESLPRNT